MDHSRKNILAGRPVHVLPVQLQNRISAGEVVERPASAVKELLENALDAGATNIRVELENAGKTLIRVTDDGHGMDPVNARLAVQRFATSKLDERDDLTAIDTFGFRGEALAAMAAVSKFRLETSPPNAESGYRLEIEAGRVLSEAPAPPGRGTQIEIRNLFYNTPARLKFIKTSATELWHAVDAVTRLALASWDVGFSLRNQERLLLDIPPATSPRERLFDLFGADFVDSSVAVENLAEDPIRVRGFVPTAIHHATRKQQYLFVNGRSVRHPMLAQAIYRATDLSRPGGRHPAFVLYVELPPEGVDVNVHPAKQEIRFADPEPVRIAVNRALHPLRNRTPGTQSDESGTGATYPAPKEPFNDSAIHSAAFAARESPPATRIFTAAPEHDAANADLLFAETTPPTDSLSFGGTFILFAEKEGLTIIDQHAAHERILYEKFLKRSISSQRLLVPRQIEMAHQDAALLDGHQELLLEFGLEVEAFGDRAVVVRQVPDGLPEKELADVLGDLAATLAEGRQPDKETVRKEVAARLACHDALRSGDTTSGPERTRLVELLNRCDEPGACPHGRPTSVQHVLHRVRADASARAPDEHGLALGHRRSVLGTGLDTAAVAAPGLSRVDAFWSAREPGDDAARARYRVFRYYFADGDRHASHGQRPDAEKPRCEPQELPGEKHKEPGRETGETFLMLDLLADLWAFMRERKKFWLAPIIIVMILLGGLIVFAKGSALAPFIYTLF